MADKLDLKDIDVLLIDPDPTSRHTIRNILADNGFRHITVGSSMADMVAALEETDRDLLIANNDISDGSLEDFVHKLRHYETEFNPFLPIIATAWTPTTDVVQSIVQSGVDHIVSKPLSAEQLMKRIRVLAKSRKQFVVTSEYIGPDRRKKDDDRESSIVPVDVPNTLGMKATGTKAMNFDDLQEEIDTCIKRVNIQKLDRNAQQVVYLVDRIVPGLGNGAPDETTTRSLDRLLYVAEDISRRMTDTPYAHVSDLCNTMIDVTKRIIDSNGEPSSQDVELLKPVSMAIETGFAECDGKTQRMAREISRTVEKSQPKDAVH